MHKKYFNFILPIFGAAVVVGSGFSAWVFSDTVSATKSISGDIILEPLATLSATLSADVSSFTLDLDQGGINNAEVDKGITLKKTDAEANDTPTNVLPVTITYTLTSDQTLLTTDWDEVKKASKYSVEVTVPDTLKAYVSVVADTTTDAEAAKLSFSQGENENTFVGTAKFNLVATYTTKVEGNDAIKGKPASKAEYNALKDVVNALGESKIGVSITAVTFDGGALAA